jgi:hypothetical protein
MPSAQSATPAICYQRQNLHVLSRCFRAGFRRARRLVRLPRTYPSPIARNCRIPQETIELEQREYYQRDVRERTMPWYEVERPHNRVSRSYPIFLVIFLILFISSQERWFDTVNIVLVGKYTDLKDSYMSVIKALEHSAFRVHRKLILQVRLSFLFA